MARHYSIGAFGPMPRLTDKNEIRTLLRRDLSWSVYALGDLAPLGQQRENGIALGGVERLGDTARHHPRRMDLLAAQHLYTKGLLNCLPRIGGPRGPLPGLDRTGAWAE